MTKEPKLDSAMRIVPEWTDYDKEIKRLQAQFEKDGGVKTVPETTADTKKEEKMEKSAEKSHIEL